MVFFHMAEDTVTNKTAKWEWEKRKHRSSVLQRRSLLCCIDVDAFNIMEITG